MSNDELERRINNKIEALVKSQADLREAIADLLKVERIQNTRIEESRQQLVALIEVARSHDERLDRIEKQQEETGRLMEESRRLAEKNTQEIAALREQGKEQDERLNVLIRIVEGHISHHP
jgi:uncharacterized pyridoxal phosphate-containing UPF0001 family protein